jgi:hypothetical protein
MLVGRFQLRSHKNGGLVVQTDVTQPHGAHFAKAALGRSDTIRSSSIPVPDKATVDKRSLVIVHVAHNGMCWTLPTAALSGCFARFG